jgi:1-acyl-sn-glycerol-3-phosphate acyltransferase
MAVNNQFDLLKIRRFAPFFWTQFLGAFNDNVFKNALVIFIAFQATISTSKSDTLINICQGLFILPFFLFSATAGQIADKYEKSRLIRYVKLLEIIIMMLAAVAFYMQSVPLLITTLFLLGTQATFFGPVKYAILPQHLYDTELIGGNGLVEMGTFVAILVGTLFGGVAIALPHFGIATIALATISFAVLGWAVSRYIPVAAAADPELKISWNVFKQSWRNIQFARENRGVFLSVLGNSWFWFFGMVFFAQITNYAKINLGGNEHIVTLLLIMFSVGIGIGSILCERLSGHKVEIGLIPFGSIGLTLFAVDLYFANPGLSSVHDIGVATFFSTFQHWRVLFDLLLLGVFGGFYIVPLYAVIQQRSAPKHRSRIIAAANILNAFFMVISSIYAIVLLNLGLTIPQLFLLTAVLNALVAVYIYSLMPEFVMRFMVWIWISILYRVKLENVEKNIPEEGPAVLVCNHVSYVDALILMASIRRPIRFVMYHKIFNIPVLRFIFKTAKAIPIAPAKEDAALKDKAMDEIATALKNGELVGIFPEGGITYDGKIQSFKPGIAEIIKRTPVPVIPLALHGLWGSFFSRKYGFAMSHMPRRIRAKIQLRAADPVAPEHVTVAGLEKIVTELRGVEE